MNRTLLLSILLTPATVLAAAPLPPLQPYASWFRPHTSTAYLYVRNTSDQPLTLQKLSINGAAESSAAWPLDPKRKSDWFDLTPPSLPPNQVGQIRVHLRAPAAAPVTLAAETSAGPLTATIPLDPPAASLADVTLAKDGSEASLFLNTTSPIAKVLVDGADVTKECDLTAAAPHQGTAAAFYHPHEHLARGSYHTYELLTADKQRAIYTMRTLANDLILGTYGQPTFQPYKDAALNLYISFGRVPPAKVAELAALNMTAAPVPFVDGHVDAKTKQYKPLDVEATTANLKASPSPHPPIAFYSAPDEPDGADHPLGVGTHGRSIVAMRELAFSLDPATPTFVQIDNTYRDANYHVYAESMDYSSTHRYNLGEGAAFLSGDRAAMAELRASTSPQPYLWVTQLYPIREKQGEHSNYNGRHPLPAEMHLQMLETLAGGAKGFIHYIHSGSTGGRGGSGLDTKLWESMVPMHKQIAAVGDVAVRATPVPWATSTDPRVHAQALFANPGSLLLVLTNNAIESTKADCKVPEITGASVRVTLPPYCRITSVTEILPGGEARETKFAQENHILTVQPPVLNVGTIYRLQGERTK